MSERFVCIHGHFYQPPRENPWLEEIENQESAYPFHDWNERITAECYASNVTSRILDQQGRLTDIVNNYSRISFNFGPTLLSWLEVKDPSTYQGILEADRLSQTRFSGHGSAIAQVYNHMILPLANSRDKRTQVLWGVRDFERRFERKPEGMWLAETAVDLESLEILAEQGIRFTILAPSQAGSIRPMDSGSGWQDVSGGRIDPSMPYLQRLPSGKQIALFFYDGPISQAVAFEKLLSNGETFARRLLSAFSDDRNRPQLAHIATDGETYGHHHRFGEMALSYALHHIESHGLARLTNYAEFLESFPPTHEVRIIENTAWSCVHGVDRWQAHYGCCSGGNPGWHQHWRAPLRQAFDWLRDQLASRFEARAGKLLRDPWEARDQYLEVILDRSSSSVDRFLEKHALRPLSHEEQVEALKLLEMQRHCLLMYTSCGWFFDEISGIETVQCIQYAGRSVQLAEEVFQENFEDEFLHLLGRAESNRPDIRNGKVVYERSVKPSRVDLLKVGAHFAVDSVFEPHAVRMSAFCYDISSQDFHRLEAGKASLIAGHSTVRSKISREREEFSFGVLHFGDHNIAAGVRRFVSEEAYRKMLDEASAAFNKADFPEVIRVLDRNFEGATYSIKSLFRDEQKRVLSRVLGSTYAEIDAIYREMYRAHYPLMRFLADSRTPLSKTFRTIAEFVQSAELRAQFKANGDAGLDVDSIRAILKEAKEWRLNLDEAGLGLRFQRTLERMMSCLKDHPEDGRLLKRLSDCVGLLAETSIQVDIRKIQNDFFHLLKKAIQGRSEEWLRDFAVLGAQLSVRVE